MKKLVHEFVSPTVFIERTMGEMAYCDSKLKELQARMDKEIFDIRDRNQEALEIYSETKLEAFASLQAFAMSNQKEMFEPTKSIKNKYGTLGFRSGKPKFQLALENNWNMVTQKIKDFLPQYVRVTIEPAKDKLLADRNMHEIAKFFPALGLSVIQEETFFVDLKKE